MMIEYGHENDGRTFLVDLLLAQLQGKTAEQFIEEWLSHNPPPPSADDALAGRREGRA